MRNSTHYGFSTRRIFFAFFSIPFSFAVTGSVFVAAYVATVTSAVVVAIFPSSLEPNYTFINVLIPIARHVEEFFVYINSRLGNSKKKSVKENVCLPINHVSGGFDFVSSEKTYVYMPRWKCINHE